MRLGISSKGLSAIVLKECSPDAAEPDPKPVNF
jgi:hypothetical protein